MTDSGNPVANSSNLDVHNVLRSGRFSKKMADSAESARGIGHFKITTFGCLSSKNRWYKTPDSLKDFKENELLFWQNASFKKILQTNDNKLAVSKLNLKFKSWMEFSMSFICCDLHQWCGTTRNEAVFWRRMLNKTS